MKKFVSLLLVLSMLFTTGCTTVLATLFGLSGDSDHKITSDNNVKISDNNRKSATAFYNSQTEIYTVTITDPDLAGNPTAKALLAVHFSNKNEIALDKLTNKLMKLPRTTGEIFGEVVPKVASTVALAWVSLEAVRSIRDIFIGMGAGMTMETQNGDFILDDSFHEIGDGSNYKGSDSIKLTEFLTPTE